MRSGKVKTPRGTKRVYRAFTLVEVVVSILILMILVNGVLGYQYFSTRDVRLSEVQASASRLALLMLESWKGSGGAGTFDPVTQFASELNIAAIEGGPACPDEAFTELGSYGVQMENTYFFVTLSWADASEEEPRALNAAIVWRNDYAAGTLNGTEHPVRLSCFAVEP